jgi:hypothetical protein
VFFVSVASKRLSVPANPLLSTLTRRLINVADKRVTGRRIRPKHGKTRSSFVNVADKGVTEAILVSVADKRLGRSRGATGARFE